MSSFLFSKEAVETSADFIVQYLRDSGYTGTLEKGTAVYDVLINLAATLYAVFQDESDRASAYLSLQRAQELKSVLGSEYDTVVDAILSNWFITRKDGTPTRGILRVYFARALSDFFVSTGDTIGYYGATQLIVRYGKVYTQSEFASVFNTVQNRTEYYLEIEVETSSSTDVDIPAGASVLPGFSNLFLYRIEVPVQFTAGEAKESSDDFIIRTENSLTTRELISYRAISTVFGIEIPDAKAVYVAGYGEPEMTRDLAEFGVLKLHYGNKADIYVHADFVKENRDCTVTNIGGLSLIDINADTGNPVARVLSVKIGERFVEYRIHQHFPSYWCSTKNSIVLRLVTPVEDDTAVVVSVLTSEVAGRAQALVSDFKQRVVCYDPLVKAKHAAVCTFMFNIHAASGADQTVLSSQVKNVCVTALNSILHTKDFSVSKLLALIHTDCWDVLSVRLDVLASYSILDPDSGEVHTKIMEDVFVLPEDISAQVSENTVQLVTFEDKLTVTFI